jgi:hypothetical protein
LLAFSVFVSARWRTELEDDVWNDLTELEDEVWDDPVDVLHRLLVSNPRKGVPDDALASAVRTRAEMWTSRLAESVYALNLLLRFLSKYGMVDARHVSRRWHIPCRSRLKNGVFWFRA